MDRPPNNGYAFENTLALLLLLLKEVLLLELAARSQSIGSSLMSDKPL